MPDVFLQNQRFNLVAKTMHYIILLKCRVRSSPRLIETPSAPETPPGSPGRRCTFLGTGAENCTAAEETCTSAVEILLFLQASMETPHWSLIWAGSDLHRLDGSSSSVLPEDLDHLVLRQRLREMKHQTGGDWRIEKVRGRCEWSLQGGFHWRREKHQVEILT